MRLAVIIMQLVVLMLSISTPVHPETLLSLDANSMRTPCFPDLADNPVKTAYGDRTGGDVIAAPAIWPFEGNATASYQQKSTRKAFFLSLLLPGLGEWYVGSKRMFFFIGVEAFAWYTYLTNNREGKDLDTDYQLFADIHWHYYDTHTSTGDTLYYNYWNYLKSVYNIPSTVGPENYDEIAEIIKNAPRSESGAHSLPPSKTQQYYEMIGKYDHFVYGWEDIIDNNPSLVDAEGIPTNKYDEDTANIQSPLRVQFMSMRGDSNEKLKTAQRGLYIMMINRVLSAIDAGRLAYKHNRDIDSDLSMVRIRVMEKHIIDNSVPMLVVFKPF